MVTRWLHFNKPYDQQIQDIIHSYKKDDKHEEVAFTDASIQEERCIAEEPEPVEEVREEERRE